MVNPLVARSVRVVRVTAVGAGLLFALLAAFSITLIKHNAVPNEHFKSLGEVSKLMKETDAMALWTASIVGSATFVVLCCVLLLRDAAAPRALAQLVLTALCIKFATGIAHVAQLAPGYVAGGLVQLPLRTAAQLAVETILLAPAALADLHDPSWVAAASVCGAISTVSAFASYFAPSSLLQWVGTAITLAAHSGMWFFTWRAPQACAVDGAASFLARDAGDSERASPRTAAAAAAATAAITAALATPAAHGSSARAVDTPASSTNGGGIRSRRSSSTMNSESSSPLCAAAALSPTLWATYASSVKHDSPGTALSLNDAAGPFEHSPTDTAREREGPLEQLCLAMAQGHLRLAGNLNAFLIWGLLGSRATSFTLGLLATQTSLGVWLGAMNYFFISSAITLFGTFVLPLMLVFLGLVSIDRNAMIQRIRHSNSRLMCRMMQTRIFLRYLCHELRIPLNTVTLARGEVLDTLACAIKRSPGLQFGDAQHLPDHLAAVPVEQLHDCESALRMMGDGATAMRKVLNDVLSLAKIESGLFSLEKAHFSLADVTRSTARWFDSFARSAGVRLEAKVDTHRGCRADAEAAAGDAGSGGEGEAEAANGAPASPTDSDLPANADAADEDSVVEGDPNRIQQVISNFLSNALKFAQRGTAVTATVRVLPAALMAQVCSRHSVANAALFAARRVAVVEVRDMGVGMGPEDQERLFRPFYQIKAGAHQKGNGTGLGLSIARFIIARHGGIIGAYSAGEGKGSVFWFALPALEAGSASTAPLWRPHPSPLPSALSSPPAAVGQELHDLASMGHTPPSPPSLTVSSTLPAPAALATLAVPASLPTAAAASALPPLTVELDGPAASANRASAADSHDLKDAGSASANAPAGPDPAAPSITPAAALSKLQARHWSPASAADPHAAAMPSVLVVDDVLGNRRLLQRAMQRRGCVAEAVADGQDALDLLLQRRESFDVVLLDKEMPGVDGHETVRRLREAGYTGVVIGVTGNALDDDIAAFKGHGANAVVSKPVHVGELWQLMQSCLSAQREQ